MRKIIKEDIGCEEKSINFDYMDDDIIFHVRGNSITLYQLNI